MSDICGFSLVDIIRTKTATALVTLSRNDEEEWQTEEQACIARISATSLSNLWRNKRHFLRSEPSSLQPCKRSKAGFTRRVTVVDNLIPYRHQRIISAKPYKLYFEKTAAWARRLFICLLYTSPSPRDRTRSRMPSSA